MKRLFIAPILLLAACAPNHPSNADARAAMVARMESSKIGEVKVNEVHALDLSGCAPVAGQDGVVCQVAMDVTYLLDGRTQRSQDTGPMRFVREGGTWKAYFSAEEKPAN